MLAVAVLLNNFMHDFSAAGWLFCVYMLWEVLKKTNAEVKLTVHQEDILELLLKLSRWSIWGIVLFGVGRVLAYNKYEWNEEAGQGQMLLLAVKHVILTVVFVAGVTTYVKAQRLLIKQ